MVREQSVKMLDNLTIDLTVEYKKRGDGYSVRVRELPVYTYVEDLGDIGKQVYEAVYLFTNGFEDRASLLKYLRENNVKYDDKESAK